ncbi:DUF4132 domain-containing protein [Clostridium sp. SHJSY1]|uniref:DUF4132 domain-containing protein n=1 Tax=Clostridium sp. SHJSY1 TaxID=2942483 RepID=UPI00287604D5|nr:DUF4132 domain-containing protein [Clostridium sp. SHJSY1]MDS0527666.1 DUF4132 domain-containing protein [Clostridium sp. SHJSY1]
MEELLNLLKVNLCNCVLKDEEIIKIRDYIENGKNVLNLNEIYQCNMKDTFRNQYNIKEDFWGLMDSFIDNEEVFKRILNVFFAIGQESFLGMVYNRFYSTYEALEYLKSMDSQERLLLWILKKYDRSLIREIINISEAMVAKDKLIISKTFNIADNTYIKLILAILAVGNSYELSEDAEKFVEKNLQDNENVNIHLEYRQTNLVQLLYYAHEKSKVLKQVISNMVSFSSYGRGIFNELVKFANVEDAESKSYDIAEKFNIDKKLYILRLIELYILNEDKKALKEIKDKIKEIPLVFKETLDFIKKSKEVRNNFEKAERLTLALYIYQNSGEVEDFEEFKYEVKNYLGGFIYNFNGFDEVTRLEKSKILEYVMENKNQESIDNYFTRVEKGRWDGYSLRYHGFCLELIYSMENTKEIIYRFLYLVLNAEKYDLASSIVCKLVKSQSMSYISLAKKLLSLGINERHLILMVDEALNPKAEEYLIMLCNEGNTELIKIIGDLKVESKEVVLEAIFNANKEKYSKVLVRSLSDDSKIIRDKVAGLLSEYEECKEQVLGVLASKKAVVREIAAKILMNFDMRKFTTEIENCAEKEKNAKVKVLLLNIVNADCLDKEILQSADTISCYCSERLKKTSYTAPEWIPISGLPEVKYEDGQALSKDVITYLISKYSLENVVERNLTAEKVIEKCNKADLDLLGNDILSIWINNGSDTKQKWVLALVSAIGGFNVVNTLKTQIDAWSKGARGAIACDAVKALALNGSDDALIIIDNIARKVKHKQIKKAAAGAFIEAAKILNLTEDDLADRIVPDLGFDKRGEMVFDFGSRSFTLSLGLDFSLRIIDNNGKVTKTLPKPNKSDDELKAKEASEEFKALKKQIKTIVSTQSLRLEMALAVNRLWKKNDWEKLFVENPIMHNFSLGLVWGVYEDGEIKDTFRYMEDGSFNTKDEEEYETLEDSFIGLAHPLEMDKETLESWQQQFEDYEIVQPFPQLQRKTYKITEEEQEMNNIERFAGTKINGLSMVGKLMKAGWYRGSVQDAGGYYQFYKEDSKIGIGVEIQFDYLGVGYENEETTIYELIFYKANTVERGSYVYDEVTDENTILPVKVPERFFSEILYDVDKALEAKTGFVDNWRMRR